MSFKPWAPEMGLGNARKSKAPSFDVMGLLAQHSTRWNFSKYKENVIVYTRGDPADCVFYLHTGQVKVSVVSKLGKEAIVAIRGPDEFCGEGALNGSPLRLATTITMSSCEIIRLEKQTIVRLLHENQEFADYFLSHLFDPNRPRRGGLGRPTIQFQRDAAGAGSPAFGQLCNDFGLEPTAVKVNQQTLAGMIGTTRSRVNFFMNKFRKLGLIDYNGKVEVHRSLLNYVLNERPHIEP